MRQSHHETNTCHLNGFWGKSARSWGGREGVWKGTWGGGGGLEKARSGGRNVLEGIGQEPGHSSGLVRSHTEGGDRARCRRAGVSSTGSGALPAPRGFGYGASPVRAWCSPSDLKEKDLSIPPSREV